MSNEKTIVIFRKDKEGIVFALFPEEPGSVGRRDECLTYQHAGQHSSANFGYCIMLSKPATQAESAPLRKELRSLGYNLDERKKASFKQHRVRWDKLNT